MFVVVAGFAASVGLVMLSWLRGAVVRAVAVAALVAALAGPAAYTVDTVLAAHTGAIPSAGPAVAGGNGGPGGGPGGFGGPPNGNGGFAGGPPPGAFAGGGFPGGPGAFAGGGFPDGPGGNGTVGGLLDASRPGSTLVSLLQSNASAYTWVAATVGANSAAGYQLAADQPCMAIGGFNGSDSWPTLAEFESLVQQHRIHYFIAGGGPGGVTSSTSSSIRSWVAAHFSATSVDGVTVYDLTATPSA